jgi:plastocyanin
MHGIRKAIALIAVLALALALAACAAPSGTRPSVSGVAKGTVVTLRNVAFEPSSLTVKAGTTVTFVNADTVPHHIVVGADDLGEQAVGTNKTWKAMTPGTYELKCRIHPSMKGSLTVTAGASGMTSGTPGGSTTPTGMPGGTTTMPPGGSSATDGQTPK